MPYADPDKRRTAKRDSARRRRVREGRALRPLTDAIDELAEPPTRDELLRLLGVQAREGNIAAIRLLLAEYRRDEPLAEPEDDPWSVIDELAAGRGR